MSKCAPIKFNHRVVCTGDLNKRVVIENRSIVAPVSGSVDFTEDFSASVTRWAAIRTVNGKTIFDGVNQQDKEITHEVYIRFDPTVTAESWITYDSRRFDIIDIEDLDERHEFMRLLCTDKMGRTL